MSVLGSSVRALATHRFEQSPRRVLCNGKETVHIKRKPVTVVVDVRCCRRCCMSIFLSLPIIVEICGRAALGRLGPGSRRVYVGMGADKGKQVFSCRAGARSSGYERKRLGLGEPVLRFLRDSLDVSVCKDDRFLEFKL